ncbi:NADH-ubiquinone oxidoreductase-F iron-sulfur binding region domain-containing protein [Haloarcula nitratireducens]|uniref:NADH dehydrogenase FAD-containing subunit n=1 Tax=Haloarcula nitratireducens TaxID=2487749 RepID=A0AAW4PGJ4_9EURY|nr:NADH-ubiquinone oxidoreductase-F iron-sulfur binding region domain-containing protein [Halomicroarcula nitratireducens]MBX0296420.1 NADH dehydrogenase FAD-containing subunit [Halomicroarcula nitratireducens]
MTGQRIIESDPAVRVSTGSENRSQGRVVLEAARDADASVATAAVGPTGHVGLEPLVTATLDGETAFFTECSPGRTRSLTEALDDGTLPSEDAAAVVEHEPGTATLPVPDEGPLAVGERGVLGPCGWAVPGSIEDYRAGAGSPPTDLDLADALSRLRETGLRGRGRGDATADASVADEWATASEAAGDPVVVVNANEADDAAAGDGLLLESAPLSVLAPALTAADALGATDVVAYLSEDADLARERVRAAADALVEARDPEASLRVVVGPDEYKAGEPTMALEAIEGNHRIEARRRPPGPSEYGLNGRPTLVHTPRTLAQVGRVLAERDLGGVPADPGTRLLTVSGDVAAPATVELPTDATLSDALPAVELEGSRKAACVGGVFGGVTRSLDVPASAPGLESARLGTNGVVELVGEATCMVALAGERAKFAREENCGRCGPCREGSKQLVDLLRDVYDGEFEDGMLRELGRTMRETSLCGFGSDAARPVTTTIDVFETEFHAHADGRCPSGTCTKL